VAEVLDWAKREMGEAHFSSALQDEVLEEIRIVNAQDMEKALIGLAATRARSMSDSWVHDIARKYDLQGFLPKLRESLDNYKMEDPMAYESEPLTLVAQIPEEAWRLKGDVPCRACFVVPDYSDLGEKAADEILYTIHQLRGSVTEAERQRLDHLRYIGDPKKHIRSLGLID
jgi:hypothetical protein